MTDARRAARWWRRLSALTWKEVLQLGRDLPLLLFLEFLVSIFIILLLFLLFLEFLKFLFYSGIL